MPSTTIHIFGSGDVQLISKDKSGKVKAETLTTLAALVDAVKAKKPADVTLTDYHVIHVFDKTVKYLGKAAEDRKAETAFAVDTTEVAAQVTALTAELTAAIAALPAAAAKPAALSREQRKAARLASATV